jgi:hypothetical protein
MEFSKALPASSYEDLQALPEVPSLKEIAVKSIISSRNCHQIIQLYDYCNVAGQVDGACLAKDFISDKFAFFLERYHMK